jgi:hypothetical protein
MSFDAGASWDPPDLIARVLRALDMTGRTLGIALSDGEASAPRSGSAEPTGALSEVAPLVLSKVLTEAAILLRSVAPIRHLDDRIRKSCIELAELVIPQAGGADVLTALCLDPGHALDHAMAHVLLRDSGYRNGACPDGQVDALLAECLSDAGIGPERAPHQELEQLWLSQIWSGTNTRALDEVLARTCWSWSLDALGSSTHDIYAFTHVLLYATDLGRRRVRPPRPAAEITADAEAALAAALDADNLDLTAELLWTWPMLRMAWSAVATFGFGLVAAAQDADGFLPGPQYSAVDHHALPARQQDEYVVKTSYHPTLVMGVLCAAALSTGTLPPTHVVSEDRPCGASDAAYGLLGERRCEPRWQYQFDKLDDGRRESLAAFVLTVAFRRARNSSDLALIRRGLQTSLSFGFLETPVTHQAIGLLRRGTLLALVPAATDRR